MDSDQKTSADEEQLGLIWEEENIPYSTAFGDYYFSGNDGADECRHVFIAGNNLEKRLNGTKSFTIAELGFGTGLNFLETWRIWQNIRKPGQTLSFVSFERHPLDSASIQRGLEQWPELKHLCDTMLKYWSKRDDRLQPWQIDEQTSLRVITGDANVSVNLWNKKADAWYLDGFTPSKNPQMWSENLMQSVFDHTLPGGTFATYTSAGWVRRNLENAGFRVQRIAGHGRKRHMTIGSR